MSDFRYGQFCPLARAVEMLGERWTLLVLRELWVGPKRFTDLKRTLRGISSSVLAERLQRLERHGIVRARTLAPPAAARVYTLAEAGLALRPALTELTRWGLRFLGEPEPGEAFEPEWVLLGLEVFAARHACPKTRIEVRIPDVDLEHSLEIRGGRRGARVERPAPGGADVVVRADAGVLLALMSGQLAPATAIAGAAVEVVDGDPSGLEAFPELFEMELPPNAPPTQ